MRKIYVDLDETLIHARVAGPRPPGKRRRFAFGLEVYDVALRPCAHYLLGCLREIGCVSLLTTSQREYAEKINEAFGLSFEQLYCREDIDGQRLRLAQSRATRLLFNERHVSCDREDSRRRTVRILVYFG